MASTLKTHSLGSGTFLLLFYVLGCSGCSGCSEQESEQSNAKPFPGQTIEIAVPAGLGFPDSWQLILDEWAEQTGAGYRLSEYHIPKDGRPLAELLGGSSRESSASAATLMVFPITDIAEMAAQGLLAPVPRDQQTAANLNWLGLMQGLRKNVAALERRPMVVPLAAPVLVCYFRKDLLDKAELSPPETWDDYRKLIDSLDRWAPGMTAVEPWGPEFRTTMFLARAVPHAKHPGNFSLFFDFQTAEPLIDGPGFVRALEAATAVIGKMPQDVKNYTPADCRDEFFSGQAALAVAFETGPGNPPLPFSPARKKRRETLPRPDSLIAGFCRSPGVREIYNRSTRSWEALPDGGVNYTALTAFAGLCAGVSANSTPIEQQAAWNLLQTLAVKNLPGAFPGATKSPCRDKHISATAAWVGDDLTEDEAQQYLHSVAESLGDTRLVAELPVVGRSQFRSALSEQLGEVLSGRTSPADALHAVAKRWREISDEVGVDNLRDSYQRSLGLTPMRKR